MKNQQHSDDNQNTILSVKPSRRAMVRALGAVPAVLASPNLAAQASGSTFCDINGNSPDVPSDPFDVLEAPPGTGTGIATTDVAIDSVSLNSDPNNFMEAYQFNSDYFLKADGTAIVIGTEPSEFTVANVVGDVPTVAYFDENGQIVGYAHNANGGMPVHASCFTSVYENTA